MQRLETINLDKVEINERKKEDIKRLNNLLKNYKMQKIQ